MPSSIIARRAFYVLLAALVVVGVWRPSLPEFVRAHWSTTIATLAAGAALVQAWRARRSHDYQAYLLALAPLVLAVLYLQPQRVASDGIFYYAPLHSVIVDGDLDFENEYRVLGATPGYFQRTVTGRLPNNFSVGPAIVWTPFFLVAHALAHLGLNRPTGFGYPYFTAVATGTVVAGLLGVLWMFRLVRAYFRPSTAFVAALLVWLASFHIWYMVFEPSMSHAMAMASVAGFLLFTHEGVHGNKHYAILGALGGIVALMRWQNVLFLPVAIAVSWARHGRPKLAELALGAAAFTVVFSPQLLYWNALYGSPLLVPQGAGYIEWGSPELEAVLFSSRHGLLSWAPLLWLGLAGLPGFARRVPVLGVSLLVAILAAWYVNASVFDWWAGASFGSRRFDAALPAFALGLAVSLEWLTPRIRRRPLAAVFALLAPFLIWNAMLMGAYFGGSVPPDGPASFRQIAADGLELWYSRTGYPPSWPAAWRGGRPWSAYDLAGSLARSNNVDIRMGDTDALYLGRGWSLPNRGRELTTRAMTGERAELFVALNEPAPYTVTLEGRAGSRAEVRFNGAPVGRALLDGDGRASVTVPSESVVAGLNTLSFIRIERAELHLSRVRLRRPGD